MPRFRTGTVTEILSARPGMQRVAVDGERAYALIALVGEVAVGDEVVVNTTAVDLGLGTGGWHPIHLNLSPPETWPSGPADLVAAVQPAPAEQALAPDSLGGMPAVACTVHSQLACVAVALRHACPDARIVYVMTDGAGLPLALSDLVAALTERGLLAATVTSSPAFGGDVEAAGIAPALAAARLQLGADAVVASMGPGVVGTSTPYGTTALEAVTILDHTAALGGVPILAVRASEADPRARHRGVSHHSDTVLRLARPGVRIAAPAGLAVEAAGHQVTTIDLPDIAALLVDAGIEVTSMGRSVADDPMFFAAAGAAGLLAAEFVGG